MRTHIARQAQERASYLWRLSCEGKSTCDSILSSCSSNRFRETATMHGTFSTEYLSKRVQPAARVSFSAARSIHRNGKRRLRHKKREGKPRNSRIERKHFLLLPLHFAPQAGRNVLKKEGVHERR